MRQAQSLKGGVEEGVIAGGELRWSTRYKRTNYMMMCISFVHPKLELIEFLKSFSSSSANLNFADLNSIVCYILIIF